MTQKILEGKDLSTVLLSNISFAVSEGDFMTLIGPSGAGKSSLLYLLNRLTNPTSGTIYYKGKDIRNYPVQQVRKEIGMVFQQPNLFPGTVQENIMYGPHLHKQETEGLAEKLIEDVQLPRTYLKRNVDGLSGGEQQRIALARALANDPTLLLLDEPTSALDVRTIEAIEEILLYLRQERGKTFMMVTHDVEQAKRLGTYTMFMQDGKLIEMNDTYALFSSPQTDSLATFIG